MLEGKSAGEYLENHTSWIRREPVGAIGQVAPWNYPMMAAWKFCPAVAAGDANAWVPPVNNVDELDRVLSFFAADVGRTRLRVRLNQHPQRLRVEHVMAYTG